MEDIQNLIAQWLAAFILKHPAWTSSLVGLIVVSTILSTLAGAWRKMSDPQRVALFARNKVTYGFLKGASAIGVPVFKIIDAFFWISTGVLDLIRAKRGLAPMFPSEDRAILTSKPGQPPQAVIVQPDKRSVLDTITVQPAVPATSGTLPVIPPEPAPLVVVAPEIAEAKRDAELERQNAVGTEEKLP